MDWMSAPWIGWECSIKVDGFYEKAIHNFHKKPSLDCLKKHLKEFSTTWNSLGHGLQEYIKTSLRCFFRQSGVGKMDDISIFT